MRRPTRTRRSSCGAVPGSSPIRRSTSRRGSTGGGNGGAASSSRRQPSRSPRPTGRLVGLRHRRSAHVRSRSDRGGARSLGQRPRAGPDRRSQAAIAAAASICTSTRTMRAPSASMRSTALTISGEAINWRSGAPVHKMSWRPCLSATVDEPRDALTCETGNGFSSGIAAWRAARRARRRRRGCACVPSSTMRPASITRMRSQESTVASRCAITSVVRSAIRRSSAAWIRVSLSASSEEVASSSSSSGASRRIARAMRDALALAARQRHPALADRGVEFLRQPADEFERVRELGGALDLGVARLRPAEADVVGDRRREDRRHPAAPARCAGARRAGRRR